MAGRRTSAELWASKQAPRKRGDGTAFKVEREGRKTVWRAVRVITLTPGSKPIQVSGTGETEAEAIAKREANVEKRLADLGSSARARTIKKRLDLGPTTRLTLESPMSDLFAEWFKWKKRQILPSKSINAQVAKSYESHIRLHLSTSRVGSTPIGEINKYILNEYFFDTLGEKTKAVVRNDKLVMVPHLSVSNRRAQQSIVNMALNYAVHEINILDVNPASGMERIPKEDYRLSNEFLENKRKMAYKLPMLLDGHPQEARWLIQLMTGIRQSEALALDWVSSFKYLDENRADRPPRMIIKQQLVRDPDTGELSIEQRTKSRSSTRIIPLDAALVEILRAHKKRQMEIKKSPKWNPEPWAKNLVFCEPDGRPTSHQRDHKRWRALLKSFREQLQGDEIRLHGLRHLFASIAITSGQTPEELKQILGHGSTAVAAATYIHLGPQNLVAPMAKTTQALLRDRNKKRAGEDVAPYDDDEYFEQQS